MRGVSHALSLLCLLSLCLPASVSAARIHAEEGREYRITREHGPWMIMVVSLTATPEDRYREGLTPEEAANELVYALRRKRIPAYVFHLDEAHERVVSQDRSGREFTGSVRSARRSLCVLAGNYPSVDDTTAQQTLKYLKGLKFGDLGLDHWNGEGSAGAVFRPTPGQPGPFSGAHLTTNPLLTSAEILEKKTDPLLLKLNAGSRHSIMENQGKYTLVVASFKGRSDTAIGNATSSKSIGPFKITGTLDDAAERAWKVASMLRDGRSEGHQKGRTFDAFVYHDRYESVVTVGEFESPNDPRIAALADVFRAKQQIGTNGQAFMTGESIQIPINDVVETVVFDPVPRLMPVPNLR